MLPVLHMLVDDNHVLCNCHVELYLIHQVDHERRHVIEDVVHMPLRLEQLLWNHKGEYCIFGELQAAPELQLEVFQPIVQVRKDVVVLLNDVVNEDLNVAGFVLHHAVVLPLAYFRFLLALAFALPGLLPHSLHSVLAVKTY